MHRHLIIFCAFLVISNCSIFAQDSLQSSVDNLLRKLQEVHVQPRTIDQQFTADLNKLFIDYLDPTARIFTKEDVASFELQVKDLSNATDLKSLAYYQSVKKRFNERLTAFETTVSSYLKQAVPLQSKEVFAATTWNERSTNANQLTTWKKVLQYEVIKQMMRDLSESQRTIPTDSIVHYEQKARKHVVENYEDILEYYREKGTIEMLYLNAISLCFDPHTNYFSPEMKNGFEEELTTERELFGLSIELNENGKAIISRVFPGGPAWLTDQIHVGQEVISIQFIQEGFYEMNEGKTSIKAVEKAFHDNQSKELEITVVAKDGSPQKVFLRKEKVYSDNDVIKNALIQADQNIGYISLPDFYVNWTDTSSLGCANDVAKCILKLKKDSIKGLILDLRGNGGGSLKEAVDLVGIFIDYGPVLGIKGKDQSVFVMKDFNRGSIYNGPLMVMIDSRSASASEIVAGALQDYNKALIFGDTSFGKASSQRIYSLDPKISSLTESFFTENPAFGYANITNGLLYRVTGKWNQQVGVVPDVQWKFSRDTDISERENTQVAALSAQPIDKKMVFTPQAALPLEQINTAYNQRCENDKLLQQWKRLLQEEQQLIKEIEQVFLDLQKELELRGKWLDYQDRKKTFVEGLQPAYQIALNSFDVDLHKANPVLEMYFEEFKKRLNQDVELIEAVSIMKDLINNK